MVVDLFAAGPVQPALAAEQGAGGVCGGAGLAERRPAGPARLALPAGGNEGQDDVVAGVEAGAACTDPDDLAGRLVAERHRHHPRP